MTDDPVTGLRRAVPTTGEHKAVRPPSGRLLAWDLPVVAGALALLAAGWLLHAPGPTRLATPPTKVYRSHGLTLTYPADMALQDQSPLRGALPVNVMFYADRGDGEIPDALRVEIDNRPPVPDSLAAGVAAGRARYGPQYQHVDTGVRVIAGREFTRVRFHYSAVIDEPTRLWVTEYTWPTAPTPGAPYTYTLTLFGSEKRTDELEATILSSTRIDAPN